MMVSPEPAKSENSMVFLPSEDDVDISLLDQTMFQNSYGKQISKVEEKELKKARRRIKNKISAQESRRRKKEYIDSLENRARLRDKENEELRKKIESLESNMRSLVDELFQIRQSTTDQARQSFENSLMKQIKLVTRATQTGMCMQCYLEESHIFPPHLTSTSLYHRLSDSVTYESARQNATAGNARETRHASLTNLQAYDTRADIPNTIGNALDYATSPFEHRGVKSSSNATTDHPKSRYSELQNGFRYLPRHGENKTPSQDPLVVYSSHNVILIKDSAENKKGKATQTAQSREACGNRSNESEFSSNFTKTFKEPERTNPSQRCYESIAVGMSPDPKSPSYDIRKMENGDKISDEVFVCADEKQESFTSKKCRNEQQGYSWKKNRKRSINEFFNCNENRTSKNDASNDSFEWLNKAEYRPASSARIPTYSARHAAKVSAKRRHHSEPVIVRRYNEQPDIWTVHKKTAKNSTNVSGAQSFKENPTCQSNIGPGQYCNSRESKIEIDTFIGEEQRVPVIVCDESIVRDRHPFSATGVEKCLETYQSSLAQEIERPDRMMDAKEDHVSVGCGFQGKYDKTENTLVSKGCRTQCFSVPSRISHAEIKSGNTDTREKDGRCASCSDIPQSGASSQKKERDTDTWLESGDSRGEVKPGYDIHKASSNSMIPRSVGMLQLSVNKTLDITTDTSTDKPIRKQPGLDGLYTQSRNKEKSSVEPNIEVFHRGSSKWQLRSTSQEIRLQAKNATRTAGATDFANESTLLQHDKRRSHDQADLQAGFSGLRHLEFNLPNLARWPLPPFYSHPALSASFPNLPPKQLPLPGDRFWCKDMLPVATRMEHNPTRVSHLGELPSKMAKTAYPSPSLFEKEKAK